MRLFNAPAQTIVVPQQAPYSNDIHTVLLEHFDTTTSGSPSAPLLYTNGVFGQAVHLTEDVRIAWNLNELPEGTVEFWGKLDSLYHSADADNPMVLIEAGGWIQDAFFIAVGASGVGTIANLRVCFNFTSAPANGETATNTVLPDVADPVARVLVAEPRAIQGCGTT